jgi:hypothetical protein
MTRRLLLVLALALSVHAQAPPTFKEGVIAFEKKEWAKAEQLMRETIAVNPRESEGTVSIAGSWFETYVPQYFLARALAKQGKCAEALPFFAETERQGVTLSIPDFARYVRTRGGCKPSATAEPPKKVIGEVEIPFEDVPRAAKPAPVVVPKPVQTAPKPSPVPAPVVDVESRVRLTAGIRAYLEGQYEVAVRVLDSKRFADRALAAEAALFRAASRDALYRLGGEQDAALRASVETDLRVYRQLKPKRKPDRRIFPPRFIAMTQM